MRIRSAALSDQGRVRRKNEDRILRDESLQLYGVADGIGGMPGGSDAAECAVDVVHHWVRRSEGDPDLLKITHDANDAVAQLGQHFSPHYGIGTTLTWGIFRSGNLHLAHVGDSRCYRLRSGRMTCLTIDHSVANEARARKARGELNWGTEYPMEALTRCIGQSITPEVDILVTPVTVGDRYLFCSDGVCRVIQENELEEQLGRSGDPHALVQGFIESANICGGIDNASAVLVIVDSLA
jgi:serine/threonine protein phosphatase PrpC